MKEILLPLVPIVVYAIVAAVIIFCIKRATE